MNIVLLSQRLMALFTKKELCLAYATYDPKDFNKNHSTTSSSAHTSNHLCHVPIYETSEDMPPTPQPSPNLDHTEISLRTYLNMEEVDLSSGDNGNEGEHVTVSRSNDHAPGYARVGDTNSGSSRR